MRNGAQKQLEKLDFNSEAHREAVENRSSPVGEDLPSSGPQKKQTLQETEVEWAKKQSSMTSRLDNPKTKRP